MNKSEIFSQVVEIEEGIGNLYKELGLLKQKIVTLLEENHHLQVENEQLRERLNINDVEKNPSTDRHREHKLIGEGHENLARLYQEGFHVCNVHYGGLRTEGDCLFCLTFLNKKS